MISEFEKSPSVENSRLAAWLAAGWMSLVFLGFVMIRVLGSHFFRSLHVPRLTH